jgi:hypothetical protein
MSAQHRVIIRLRGGLGNQISCFYAGLYLARINKAILVVDGRFIKFGGNPHRSLEIDQLDLSSSGQQFIFKKTIPLPKSRIGRKIARPLLEPLSRALNLFERIPVLGDKDSLTGLRINSDVRLDGYFSNYENFESCYEEGLIQSLHPLSTSLEYQEAVNIVKSRVSLHIRLGDYLLHPETYAIPSENYYVRALEITQGVDIGYNVFVENLDEAQERFPKILAGAVRIFTNKDFNSVETLCLMSNSKHLIAANSSFSSWAGIYVSKRNGTVVVPDRITNHDLEDSRPKEWIRLNLTG